MKKVLKFCKKYAPVFNIASNIIRLGISIMLDYFKHD